MKPFGYQIVVQWDTRRNMYTAYSPTLSTFASKFSTECSGIAFGYSMSHAVTEAEDMSEDLLLELGTLGILPPPADIGPVDPVGYETYEERLEKIILQGS